MQVDPAPAHMIEIDRLLAAYEKAREDLLEVRKPEGHWVGELASSALATATAVSALALVRRSKEQVVPSSKSQVPGQSLTGDYGAADLRLGTWDLGHLIQRGIEFLPTQQNADGGFGDTDLSHSNIATTMLVRAAFHLAGMAANDQPRRLLDRAGDYIAAKGGIAGLRARYGKDKTFAVPILTNCALAGLVEWREVSPLPFEWATFPQSWYRFLRLPVVSYAIPALVAIGQARYFHHKPRNLLVRTIRAASVRRTLRVLERMQPTSGGYLEAIPLTSFVVMSLAGTGRASHPVAQRGVQFLLDTVRPDGSWPIDTNLATWVTTLAVNALAVQARRRAVDREPGTKYRSLSTTTDVGSQQRWPIRSEESAEIKAGPETWTLASPVEPDLGLGAHSSVIEWLLSCQHTQRHPFTGAAPGGWGWSDLSGAVPDVDDTSGALLALSKFVDPARHEPGATHVRGLLGHANSAALSGIYWLLTLQNRDGGWPTFCRGWGALPFDRSAPDLTAHAMRAIGAWLPRMDRINAGTKSVRPRLRRGFNYLVKSQRPDGSWVPLWFGNQDYPHEENPVYGTSRVLLAYRDLQRMSDEAAIRGVRWLVANQNRDDGWGTDSPKSQLPSPKSMAEARRPGTWDLGPGTITTKPSPAPQQPSLVLNTSVACGSSVEETAWAVEGLLAGLDNSALAVDNSLQNAIRQGVDWLVRAVEDGRHRQPAPVGFYFAKLWYYERLYPLIFTVGALGQSIRRSRGSTNV